MKKRGHSRRLLSVLLALVMLLSLLPTAVFAADPAPQTFKKVTSAEELVTGQYVLVDEKGFSPKELSGKWVTTAAVTVNGATATASEGIWTITVSADGVVLTDANNVSIAPSGGNNNGIKSGSYKWSVAFANGAFTFSGQGSDTVKLAGNAGSSNQYKAYKNSTVSAKPNGYPSNFTLYKLDAASARQSGIVTDLTTLRDGDKIVVFNPSVKKAMSATAVATYYRAGVDVTLDSANKLTGYGDTELWTLGIKDGKYTFTTADGKKLSMGASYSSIPLDDVNTEWTITSAATEGCFYIKNVARGNALQWYADKVNFSSKASISTTDEALFAQQLYLVIDSGSETPDPEPGPTALIKDGKYVIYNPGSGKAMSADATGTYYRAGKDVTVTNGKVDNPSADLIWTVSSTDGIYTITTSDGKKLSMNADRNSLPLDEVNDTWKVEKAKTDGCFYLINANRPTYYVEWFVNSSKGFEEFTTYTYKEASDNLYTLQFIPVSGSDQPSGGLPTVGDQVVIHNQNAQAVLAAQNDNATSPAINKAAATIQDGKATCANGAVVFEVQKNGDYYRFYNKTYGYLCANGTGNNAFYTQTASDDADWLVRTCSGSVGGYEMEHRTAKFNGKHSQWLEYYSDSFKVYSMYNVTDYTIYSFSFYPVGPGTISDGVVNNPAVVLGDLPYAYVGTDYSFTFTVDAPFGVRGDMTAKLNGAALTVTKGEDGTYTVTIPAASVTGDKLTVNISGTDNKHIPISAAADIAVKDEPVFSDPTPPPGAARPARISVPLFPWPWPMPARTPPSPCPWAARPWHPPMKAAVSPTPPPLT